MESTMLQWRGHQVIDSTGDRLGTIDDLYLDEETDTAEWALVNMGLFGGSLTLVPLAGAVAEGDQIRVPFEKARVKAAPVVTADRALSQPEEQELYEYYGLPYDQSAPDTGLPTGAGEPKPDSGHDTSGPTTDSAMTRSEEELRVGTVKRETGRVRLRKYITTEQVQTSVPVQREEIRIEREPITEANAGAAMDGPALSEEEHEVVLESEEVVVDKQVVPKERIRLDKDVVTEERQVTEEVRKEQVEVEGDARP